MRLLDLTQPLSPRTARSADHRQVQFPAARWRSRNGISTHEIAASLHSGTHVDAPSMYDPDGRTVDVLPLDGFCGEGVVVDVALGEWGVVDADVLERRAADVREGDIVALWTDWGRRFRDEETYILKAPGLDRSGVDWLVERKVRAVYSDTPSAEHVFMRRRMWESVRPDLFGAVDIDPERFPASYGHKTLLPNGIMMVENLSEALGEIVGRRLPFMALPAKYEGVEAAPARVVAVLEFG
jgi:arylformamidase